MAVTGTGPKMTSHANGAHRQHSPIGRTPVHTFNMLKRDDPAEQL